jgi:hypothetical protein
MSACPVGLTLFSVLSGPGSQIPGVEILANLHLVSCYNVSQQEGFLKPRPEIQQPEDTAIRLIPLTQGQVAIVDSWNFDRINQHRWCAHRTKKSPKFYAIRHATDEFGKIRRISMAREVLQYKGPDLVDHVADLQTLDNRESNLRVATEADNRKNRGRQTNNTSGFVGVFKVGGRSKRWGSRLVSTDSSGKKTIYRLGNYLSKEEAARVRDRKAIEIHGDFCVLNFPRSDYEIA